MIQVYDSVDKLLSIESDWRKLQGEDCSLYQSFEYVIAAVPLLSGSLNVLAWSKKGKISAIFPLYVDKRHTLRFINDIHTDFCSPVMAPDIAGDYHMCEELAEYIKSSRHISRVRLENIRSDRFQSSLQLHLSGSFLYSYRCYSYVRVPAVGSAGTHIDALAHLSTKEKYRLKNIESKIRNAGAESRIWRAADDAWPETVFEELFSSMIEAGIRKASYFSHDFMMFLKRSYESGKIMVFVTFCDERPVSCNLFLQGKHEWIDWIALYKDPSYNGWNLLQFIGWLSGNGGGVLNFARGIYKYKLHNYRPALGKLDRFVWSKSFFCKCADAAICMISEIKRSVRLR